MDEDRGGTELERRRRVRFGSLGATARAIGVDPHMLRRYELGEAWPGGRIVIRYAEALGISAGELLQFCQAAQAERSMIRQLKGELAKRGEESA